MKSRNYASRGGSKLKVKLQKKSKKQWREKEENNKVEETR